MKSTRLPLILLVASLTVVPFNASAQPADTAPIDDRIRRLEILAELWGKLWLFHPAIVTTDIDWEQVLVDAIPKVESARSTDELVEVLNESLLAGLDDPLSVVFRSDASAPPSTAPQLSGKRLSPDIGYVNASNPDEYWQNDFSKRFKDAVNELGDVSRLVVDLRFTSVTQTPVEWTGQALLVNLLNWFVDEEVETAGRLVRVHEGWNQNNAPYDFGISVYAQRWKTIPGSILRPNQEACLHEWFVWCRAFTPQTDLSPITKPVVFVVNNTSLPLAAQALDSLQSRGRAVVIWEKQGSFAGDWQNLGSPVAPTMDLPLGIAAHLNLQPVVSRFGHLGVSPDHSSEKPLSETDLDRLARDLRPRSVSPERREISRAMRFPSIEEASIRQLTREKRLLGLFKIWTIIAPFYPHLELADIDWPTFLESAIPDVEAAEGFEEYYRTLQRLTAPLNDSHIVVWHTFMNAEAQLPVRLRWVDGKVVVTERVKGLGLEDKIRIGDEVIAIDGGPIDEIMAAWSPLISSSTPGAHHRELARHAEWRDTETPAQLRLNGPDGTRTVEVPNRPQGANWDGESRPFEVLPGNLGYIKLSETAGPRIEAAMDAVAGTEGLILDARGYPANRRIVQFIASEPVRSPTWEVPIVSGPNNSYLRPEYEWIEPDATKQYRGPVVVLIDEYVQSAPEDVCIFLKNSGRATFVGASTAGSDGNVTRVWLPGGGWMRFTGMRVRYANGDPFQNIGVLPDVEVHPTIEGIRAGRDEVLEKGIGVLTQ